MCQVYITLVKDSLTWYNVNKQVYRDAPNVNDNNQSFLNTGSRSKY